MTRTLKGTYASFAEKHLDIVNVTGEEAMVRCVVHDDSKASMQFNLSSGLWVCFACHEGGSIKRLCREMGLSLFHDPTPDLDDLYAKLKDLSVPTKRDGIPKPINESVLSRYTMPTPYWKDRGFDERTIKAFDLGYDPLNGFVTIPVRDENHNLLGIIKRYLEEDAELRYRYPKGFKRSMNLFASWLVEHAETSTVALVEGSVDAMKVWQAGIPAVALYGSSLSLRQVRLLRRLGVQEVVEFFDNDKAGRHASDNCIGLRHHTRKKKAVIEYDDRLDLRRDFILRRVDYTGSMPSDPGACSVKQIKKAIRRAPLHTAGY